MKDLYQYLKEKDEEIFIYKTLFYVMAVGFVALAVGVSVFKVVECGF
jgi:hypothetical protein